MKWGACLVVWACAGGTPDDKGDTDTGDETDVTADLVCGDNVLSPNEVCEGFELRGETCVTQGFSAGRLACTSDCVLDTTACSSCGDDTADGSEVCDGTDVQ
ncbi:MAG: hypothetical protein KC656_23260, partial [Myxococcales bacterium]|nr:hypothetical protein [Myxococcales bacterium]